jgi:hypothetical protein
MVCCFPRRGWGSIVGEASYLRRETTEDGIRGRENVARFGGAAAGSASERLGGTASRLAKMVVYAGNVTLAARRADAAAQVRVSVHITFMVTTRGAAEG